MAILGSFFEAKVDLEALPSSKFTEGRKHVMIELNPTQMVDQLVPKLNMPVLLEKTSYVFIPADVVLQPLKRSYTGLYKVIAKPHNISVDRIKYTFTHQSGRMKSDGID